MRDKEVLTDEEVKELEEQKAAFDAAEPSERPRAPVGFTTARVIGDPVDEQAYNSFWFDTGTRVVSGNRTSLITDPSNGRIPYTETGRARAARRRGTDNPEDRGLTERCILSMNAGPPIRPGAYNNNLEIVQTARYVLIINEMIRDARIVPIDGRPHLPSGIRQWRGDSRGRWEGPTLVVETTNFSDKVNFSGATENARVIERFTRLGRNTLNYEFTVIDASSFSKPWTAAFAMARTDERIFEYACHEGNVGLANILSGARATERLVEPPR
jgi:hypothetical protein